MGPGLVRKPNGGGGPVFLSGQKSERKEKMNYKIALESWMGREEQYHTAASIVCNLQVVQSHNDDLDKKAIVDVAKALRYYAMIGAKGLEEYDQVIALAELHEAVLIG